MKKKLIAALCLVLCVLLGAGAGYLMGHDGLRRSVLDSLFGQWSLEQVDRIANESDAAVLAEAYYNDNFNPDGKDPRLTAKAFYIPEVGSWLVILAPENYVLAKNKSFSTLTDLWSVSTYSLHIRAKDGMILSIDFE